MPDRAQQDALKMARPGFSVEIDEIRQARRTFGMLGIAAVERTNRCCQQNRQVILYFEVLAPQKHGFTNCSLKVS